MYTAQTSSAKVGASDPGSLAALPFPIIAFLSQPTISSYITLSAHVFLSPAFLTIRMVHAET